MTETKLKFESPPGLSPEKTVEILQSISETLAERYLFGHSVSFDDLVQQGILEGLECIASGLYKPEKYYRKDIENSPEICLRRFMSRHIRNRLSNYKRNNSRRGPENKISKHDLLHTLTLDENLNGKNDNHEMDVCNNELIKKIKSQLSKTPDMLNDFYRLMDGANLQSQRKLKLQDKIREILAGEESGKEENTD